MTTVHDENKLDILPSGVDELQSLNPWIQEAFTRAIKQKLDENTSILTPTLFDFLALKVQAFEDRGNNDFLAKNMDDIVTVIDGFPFEFLGNQSTISKEMANFLDSKLNALMALRNGFPLCQ